MPEDQDLNARENASQYTSDEGEFTDAGPSDGSKGENQEGRDLGDTSASQTGVSPTAEQTDDAAASPDPAPADVTGGQRDSVTSAQSEGQSKNVKPESDSSDDASTALRPDEQSLEAQRTMKEAADRPDSEAPIEDPTSASGKEKAAGEAEARMDDALGGETQVEGEQA